MSIDQKDKYLKFYSKIGFTRICPLCGHILAPPEGLRAPELPGVNPGGRPQESGGNSKVI